MRRNSFIAGGRQSVFVVQIGILNLNQNLMIRQKRKGDILNTAAEASVLISST